MSLQDVFWWVMGSWVQFWVLVASYKKLKWPSIGFNECLAFHLHTAVLAAGVSVLEPAC